MNKGHFILLLCVVGLMLTACSKGIEDEPEEKTKSGTTTTKKPTSKEADLEIKYYLNDSLLQNVHFSIVDSLHLEDGELPYSSIAPLDTLHSDAVFWQQTMASIYHFNPSLYTGIPVSTIKVITFNRHLSQGSHIYCLRFTPNEREISSENLPILVAQSSTSSLKKWNTQTQFEAKQSVSATEWMSELQSLQNKLKTSISF